MEGSQNIITIIIDRRDAILLEPSSCRICGFFSWLKQSSKFMSLEVLPIILMFWRRNLTELLVESIDILLLQRDSKLDRCGIYEGSVSKAMDSRCPLNPYFNISTGTIQ